MGQGFQTVQDFQDPQELIAVKRRGDSGWIEIGTFYPISIKLANQQAISAEDGNEVRKVGALKMWEIDYSLLLIKVGDRFNWQNQPCRVTLVPAGRFGTVDVEFELIDEDV